MKRRSAGRRLRGRVLPLFRVRCQWYGKEQHHEKIFGAEAGTARRRQLSFVRAGGNFLAAGISRLSSAGAGRERSERCRRAVACPLEPAQRRVQRVRDRLRNDCLCRHSGTENQAAARRNLSVRHHGVDFCPRLPHVPALHERLRRHVSGCNAPDRHRAGGAAVDRVAERHYTCRRKKPRLPLLRHLRRRCPPSDAHRRAWHEACTGRLLWRGRALQRVCRDGL